VLFRRRSAGPDEAIAEFWDWWPSIRPELTASIDAHEGGLSMVDEIGAHVRAIHPDLEWELGKGERAEHALVVSPAGNPGVRAAAARWRAAAPPEDATWEFHDARQRNVAFDDFTLQIDGHKLEMSDTRFGLIATKDEPHTIDVTVYHPVFPQLPDQLRQQVTYLSLDWALGENGVEVWVGMVEPMSTVPPQACTVHDLRRAVDRMIERHREPQWAMLSGETASGEPVMAVVQVPLRSARWPRLDTHVGLTLPFVDRGNGLPTDESLQEMRDIEDRLDPLLGADGELVGHETLQSHRTLHYYVDGQSDLADRLRQAVLGWQGTVADVTHDPDFENVRHLAT
jgi:hypothetical protein